MALPDGPVVLPFKAERLSFGVSYTTGHEDRSTAAAVPLELAAVCFDRDGKLVDAAHPDRRAALCGSLRLLSGQQLVRGADEVLVMAPFDFAPQVEVMLLAVSAPASPLRRSDLSCPKQLRFLTTAKEKGAAEESKVLDVDLYPFVAAPAPTGAGTLTNGHQSMLICAVYSTPSGWTVSFDCSTFPIDNWGALLPDMERALGRWPVLSAAEAAASRAAAGGPLAAIVGSRRGEDRALAELTAAPQAAEAAVAGATAAASTEPAAPAAAGAAAAALPERLVLELGWALHPPRKGASGEGGEGGEEEEEPEEDPELEFTLAAYDLKGEELMSVSPESPEAEGLAVADPEEEAAAEGAAEGEGGGEEKDGGGGSGEGGGEQNGEEDGEGKEEGDAAEGEEGQEESEEAAAAKKAAAAAKRAEEEAERRAAALRKPYYPEAFPKKHQVTVTLGELPKAARSLLLTISNFGGGGLKRVASLQARLLLPGASKGAERVLLHCRFTSAEGADEPVTQVAMLKLYKQLGDGAFAAWAASAAVDTRALAESVAAKDLLASILEGRKQLVAEVVAAKTKAEEEGLEEDENEVGGGNEEDDIIAECEAAPGGVCARSARVQRQRLRRGAWRARVLVAAGGGEEPDEALVANALSYEGELTPEGLRQDPAAKALYPNGDTYFGGYSADAKGGHGLYVFAGGGAYLGAYSGGRREGRGLMLMPDGGSYDGEWAADKFEGQGSYRYPDGSFYTGAWKAGRKHGRGTFWDTAGGCLAGDWERGQLAGEGRYDQPHYHFSGVFVKSVPAGPCSFEMAAFRSAGLPPAATGYIVAEHGPTLHCEGAYAIPAGAGAEAEGEEAPADGQAAVPAFPKYEGLAFQPGDGLPKSVPDLAFPPTAMA